MKIAAHKEITEVLEAFGLHPKEQTVYLALLPLGATTLTPLARAADLPLTTVQSIVERLVKRGLVAVSKHKSRQVYEAYDPGVLRTILHHQIEEVATIIPDLRQIMGEAPASPRVKVYVRERVADIFHDALRAKSKTVYEIVAARDLQAVLGEKFHFSRRRIRAGVKLQSLRVASQEIKKYTADLNRRELREARFLPRELTFRSSFMWWDDTIAIFSPKSEGLAVTITSPALRETLTQVFKLLWSVSRQF